VRAECADNDCRRPKLVAGSAEALETPSVPPATSAPDPPPTVPKDDDLEAIKKAGDDAASVGGGLLFGGDPYRDELQPHHPNNKSSRDINKPQSPDPMQHNPYISEGSSGEWPVDLPMPRILFSRTQRLPPSKHLDLVCRVERIGLVGDVIFDLRHQKLDPITWIGESLFRSGNERRRYPNRPYLWFPWYGVYTSDLSKNETCRATRGQGLSRTKREIIEQEFSPEQIVLPGDRISVDRVDIVDDPSLKMRDVVQETPVRLAFLKINRQDGSIAGVDTPLRFFRQQIKHDSINIMEVVSNIRKIIHKPKNQIEYQKLLENAESIAASIHYSLYKLNIGDKLPEVEDIVSSSIMLGQYWAKSEAATTVEPLAIIAEQSKIKSSIGGVKGGNTRRNRPWRSIAQILIIKERRKNPIFSQDALATHVLALWADENISPPTHKVIKN
jgi:hypothetical protein